LLSELEKKIDLMQIDDDEVESFRDVIIDVALKDNHCNIAPAGETITFRGNVASEYTANECSLEVITHEKISKDLELSERLEDSLKFYGFDNIDRDLLHSKYLLNMSAEDNIKIDIIWGIEKTGDEDFPNQFCPISIHFEDAGTSIGGEEEGIPNFDPRSNGYWEEFLADFGIKEDPYSDYEED
jgi:hypothetical protein